jgi:molecular chaperone GrpE
MPDPDDPTENVPTATSDAEPPPPDVDADDADALGLDRDAPADVVAEILETKPADGEAEAPAEPQSELAPASKPEPEPAPVAGADDGVRRAIDRLGERLDQRLAGLQAQFDREVRAEAGRERVVDRLHAELQEYKQDLLLKVQRPIFIDLIQLHDDVGKMAEAQGEGGEAVRGMLESIQTAVEDVLYRQGVEPFRAEGDAFDPRRQRAVTTTPTDDPALARTIAQRLRPGFQAGDRIIRPEMVTVYTLAPAKVERGTDADL